MMTDQDPRDLPKDNGKTAAVEPSGEVRGSGMGAGGGQPGEDFDDDAAGGDAYPFDGPSPTDERAEER